MLKEYNIYLITITDGGVDAGVLVAEPAVNHYDGGIVALKFELVTAPKLLIVNV